MKLRYAFAALLALSAPAIAAIHGSGQTAPTILPIVPAATWDGTAASCGSPPAVNPALQGSGFTEQVAAILDTPSEAWVDTSSYTVGVAAFNGDPAFGGIAKVTFWLCGNSQDVTSRTLNTRTNIFDFNINIASTDAHNGDAYLYAYATPVNGYERRIGPFHFVLDNSGVAAALARTHWYLDPAGGTDPTLISQCGTWGNVSPTGTPAHLFKTLSWASYCAGVENTSRGGGIVHLRAGTVYEDDAVFPPGNPTVFNARSVTFQPDTAVADGAFKWSRTCRNGAATVAGGVVTSCATNALVTSNYHLQKSEFRGITFDLGQFASFQCGGTNCYMTLSANSAAADANGAGGPMIATTGDGDSLASAGGTSNGYHVLSQTPLSIAINKQYAIVDSTLNNYIFAGPQLMRSVTGNVSFDFSSMTGPIGCLTSLVPRCSNQDGTVTDISVGSNNTGVFKTTVTQPGPFKASHFAANSTAQFGGSCTVNGQSPNCVGFGAIASIAANTPIAGQYTITWSGSPVIDDKALGQPNEFLEMTSGTCAGYSNRIPFVSEVKATFTTVVAQTFNGYTSPCSPASLAATDKGFTWLLGHPDCMQVLGQLRSTNNIANPNLENLIFQQYECSGPSMQLVFPQTGPQNITFTGPSTLSVTGTTIFSDELTASSVSGATVTWTGSPLLLTSGTGSGYSSRYKISGGPLNNQIFTVSSQSNVAHTTTFTVDMSTICGGGACSGVTAHATLETIAGNFFNKCTPITSIPTNCVNTHSAAFNGSMSGNTLTINSGLTGTVAIGQMIYGVGVTGSPTITAGSGTSWTFSGSTQTIANEAMTAGLSTYEYATVVSTPNSSLDDTTATLDHAFTTTPIVNGSFSLARSVKDWMIVSSYLASTDPATGAKGQIQNGSKHWATIQSTVWGLDPVIQWRNGGNFGTKNTSIFDSIFQSVDVDAGPSGFPGQSSGGNFSNNVIQSGTLPTGATVVGGLTLDADGKPTGGTLAGNTLGHTPIFPRSLSDQVLTSGSLVGAQQP